MTNLEYFDLLKTKHEHKEENNNEDNDDTVELVEKLIEQGIEI